MSAFAIGCLSVKQIMILVMLNVLKLSLIFVSVEHQMTRCLVHKIVNLVVYRAP